CLRGYSAYNASASACVHRSAALFPPAPPSEPETKPNTDTDSDARIKPFGFSLVSQLVSDSKPFGFSLVSQLVSDSPSVCFFGRPPLLPFALTAATFDLILSRSSARRGLRLRPSSPTGNLSP